MKIVDIESKNDGEKVLIQGRITDWNIVTTDLSGDMSFCAIEDSSGSVEVVLFPDVHSRFSHHVELQTNGVLVNGTINKVDEGWSSQVKGVTCSSCVILVNEMTFNN